MFNVRPYLHTDEQAVYNVCRKACKDEAYLNMQHPDHPDLLPDKLVGAFLTLSPQYCFVIEGADGEICGYVLAALDGKAFQKQMEIDWLPAMQQKYTRPPLQDKESFTPTQDVIESFYNPEVFLSDEVFSRTPSVVHMEMLNESSNDDRLVLPRAAISAFSALHANGSAGVHVDLPMAAKEAAELYTQLGFVQILGTGAPEMTSTLARPI